MNFEKPDGGQSARYGLVVVLGFVVDFALSLALSLGLGVPLELAAVLGFLVAAGINYMFFEFWVFESRQTAVSTRRLGLTVICAVLALSARVSIIALVSSLIGRGSIQAVAAMLAGAAVSISVNYLLIRKVFV